MSEAYPQTTAETFVPVAKKLSHESIEIPKGQILYDLEITRECGINGVTLAELILPSKVAPGSTTDKKIALIDFGEEAETTKGRALLYDPTTQQEIRGVGVVHTRHGLVTSNHSPRDQLVGYIPLRFGQSETIGRDECNRNNHLLGLLKNNDNEINTLSRAQVTVTLSETGIITIKDHSTNGTTVVLPAIQ
jgi:hypothetical protein